MTPSAPADIDTYLKRAYALRGPSEAQELYDDWALNYDSQLHDTGYASPRRTVETIVNNIGSMAGRDLKIFDAGCGTGLVGSCLSQSSLGGKFVVDGVDISSGMLDVARQKNVYRELHLANLNSHIDVPDQAYDVVACVGTLTKGHVGPSVLREFIRILISTGLAVFTVHDEVWESGGFRAEVETLRDESSVEVVSSEAFGILEQTSDGGRMIVLRKT